MTIKLYYAPQTRALRPRWVLEELGLPYELVRLNLARREHKRPEYLRIHPQGAVPALTDDGVTLIESAAICQYLADKYPERRLAPSTGTPERGAYYQWIAYALATVEPPLVDIFVHSILLPEMQRIPGVVEAGRKRWRDAAGVLTEALDGRRFILGAQFSVADVMIGSLVGWARQFGMLEGYPALAGYERRLIDRSAYQRAAAD